MDQRLRLVQGGQGRNEKRAADRRRVAVPGQIVWKDERGTTRMAPVRTRDRMTWRTSSTGKGLVRGVTLHVGEDARTPNAAQLAMRGWATRRIQHRHQDRHDDPLQESQR